MPDDVRPLWADENDVVVAIEQRGAKHKVPPSVKQRFDEPLDAVPARDTKKVKVLLGAYNITHGYVPPENPTAVPTAKCVVVYFRVKEDIERALRPMTPPGGFLS